MKPKLPKSLTKRKPKKPPEPPAEPYRDPASARIMRLAERYREELKND